jgi:hypothetical protein
MEQWAKIAGQFGIPIIILGALSWFLYKRVWPFIVDQIKEAQALRKLEVERFVETIRNRDIMMGEMQREHTKSLDAIVAEIRGLRTDLRIDKK